MSSLRRDCRTPTHALMLGVSAVPLLGADAQAADEELMLSAYGNAPAGRELAELMEAQEHRRQP